MPVFKDAAAREWTLAIDAPTILMVRETADDKFMIGQPGETIDRLGSDNVLLCQVIHALCSKQMAERGIDSEQFYLSVIGDAIDDATDKLLEAIVNFTPRRARELLQASAAKNSKIRQLATSRAMAKIDDPELEQKIMAVLEEEMEQQIRKATTRQSSASSAPAPLESTPPA